MKLSGLEIKERRRKGEIVIDPWDEAQLNPNSYNLRLGRMLLVYAEDSGPPDTPGGLLDMAANNLTHEHQIPDEGMILVPGRIYLGHTLEYTETHELIPCLEGRSSIGRLGINVHNTAGFGDVGFCGCWTLEISVVQPVRVYPFVQFCQICYEPILGNYRPYESQKAYANQQGPRPSGIWKELREAREGRRKPKNGFGKRHGLRP